MWQLETNKHSQFLLYYNLILAVKYRREIFNDAISARAKAIFEKIAPAHKITLQEWNYDADNLRISFKAQPKTEISKFLNAYKSVSSRFLKKEFPR
jgi:putative transposase